MNTWLNQWNCWHCMCGKYYPTGDTEGRRSHEDHGRFSERERHYNFFAGGGANVIQKWGKNEMCSEVYLSYSITPLLDRLSGIFSYDFGGERGLCNTMFQCFRDHFFLLVSGIKVSRQRKDIFRLEQEREKLGSELSEAQNMYMQSLEDVKVSQLSKVTHPALNK